MMASIIPYDILVILKFWKDNVMYVRTSQAEPKCVFKSDIYEVALILVERIVITNGKPS